MRSSDFIVQTNHDVDHTTCCGGTKDPDHVHDQAKPKTLLGGEMWLDESVERQDSFRNRWLAHAQRRDAKAASIDTPSLLEQANLNGTCVESIVQDFGTRGRIPGITKQTLERWLQSYPVTNECTHFSAIMDPLHGTIVFLERGPDEVDSDTD